jgi:hypothetical protein
MAIVIESGDELFELTIHPKTIYWYKKPKLKGKYYHWLIFTWCWINPVKTIEEIRIKTEKFNELMDKLK